MKRQITEIERELVQRSGRSKPEDRIEHSEVLNHLTGHVTSNVTSTSNVNNTTARERERDNSYPDPELEALDPLGKMNCLMCLPHNSNQKVKVNVI